MIYTRLTKMAMKLAYEAHAGQVDKTGIPGHTVSAIICPLV